jgi:uncharacterized protein (TIGR03437 family)
LPARIANATVPQGGVAQIQLYLSEPNAIVKGGLTADLDPAVFGDIESADVFSVTGDQIGVANINGRHLDLSFSSLTGGIGRLPNVPVAVLNVPVLSAAVPGTKTSISVTQTALQWQDVQAVTYNLTVTPGTVTVGGSLSVKNLASDGALVRVSGTGFLPGTSVDIDGVSIESTQFVNANLLNVTLTAATDLTAKRVTVSNPDGERVVFFPALRATSVQRPATGPLATVQPIFPQQLYAAGNAGNFTFSSGGVALQNSTVRTVDVTFKAISVFSNRVDVQGNKITLPPGAIYIQSGAALGGLGVRAQVHVAPSAPIRMAVIDVFSADYVAHTVNAEPVMPAIVSVFEDGTSRDYSAYYPLTYTWAVGSDAPPKKKLAVTMSDVPTPFTASVSSTWLSVTPISGTTCNSQLSPGAFGCAEIAKVTVAVNPSGLAPGTYNAEIRVTPEAMNPKPAVIPVVLNVSAQPLIFVDAETLDYGVESRDKTIPPRTLTVTDNGGPTPFKVMASTQSGQNWLSVSPSEGVTPAAVTMSINPAAMTSASDTGTITIQGPYNQRSVSVSLKIVEIPKPPIAPNPAAILVSAPAGTTASTERVVAVSNLVYPFTVAAKTQDGGNWLSASVRTGPGVPSALVQANPAGLAAGTYRGTVTIDSATAAGPVDVPVRLTIWSGPPPKLTVNTTSLTFTAPSGSPAPKQTFSVTSGDTPLDFSVVPTTSDGGYWLQPGIVGVDVVTPTVYTPANVDVNASAVNLAPGKYTGTLTITAPPGSTNSATVNVTLDVTPAPPVPPPLPQQGAQPLATSVLNAASQTAGALVPGEILTVFGQNIGPATPVGFTLGFDGKVAREVSGTQLLMNGTPAPLLYVSATQINAIVPYELTAGSKANMEVRFNGAAIPAGTLPVREAGPGIFTLNSSGQGPAAVLNEDNSVNAAAHPAARGSVIQIFATGAGALSPPGVTGEITTGQKQPLLPVKVMIGGIDASIIFAGAAPNAVSGLLQVNAVVPQSAAPGPSVPVVLSIGSARSPDTTTLSIR